MVTVHTLSHREGRKQNYKVILKEVSGVLTTYCVSLTTYYSKACCPHPITIQIINHSVFVAVIMALEILLK